MNILILGDAYPPYHGGLEKMTRVLAHGLAARGHAVAVVTSHYEEPLPDMEWEGIVAVHRLPLQPSLLKNDVQGILENLRKFASIKRSFQPDVVHIQSEAVSSYFHMRTGAAWPCPTVLTLHGEVRQMQAEEGTMLGSLLKDASRISTVSGALLRGLCASVPAATTKASVIYNAVPSMGAIPQKAADRGAVAPTILACGRLSSEKGFDVLLQAFALLAIDVPEAKLVIAGDGRDEDTLRDMAVQLGLASRVEFTGWLSGDALRLRMGAATLQVVPSTWAESFGLVALEGAMMGLPVIATRVGGLPEVVEDGVTGLIVPPCDPAAMRDAMLRLLRSPDLRKELGEAGRRRASRFDLDSMLSQYEAMYRDAVDERRAPTAMTTRVDG